MAFLKMSADEIDNLPVDKSMPTPQEEQLMNMLFKEEKKNVYVEKIREIVMMAGFFILFTLIPDSLIAGFLPPYIAGLSYVVMGVKAIVLAVLHYVVKNLPVKS